MNAFHRDTWAPERYIASAPLLDLTSPPLRAQLEQAHEAAEALRSLYAEREAVLKVARKLERRAQGRGLHRFTSQAKRDAARKVLHDTEVLLLDLDHRIEDLEEVARLDPGEPEGGFERLASAFDELCRCAAVWDLVWERRGEAYRANVGRTIDRKPVRLRAAVLPSVSPDLAVPHFPNANGPGLYFYPAFVVAEERGRLAFLRYGDCTFDVSVTRFREDERLPADAEVVGYSWKYENKDGSPDRRFSGNHQIPVAAYGLLLVTSVTGLEEELMFSSAQRLLDFAHAIPSTPAPT